MAQNIESLPLLMDSHVDHEIPSKEGMMAAIGMLMFLFLMIYAVSDGASRG